MNRATRLARLRFKREKCWGIVCLIDELTAKKFKRLKVEISYHELRPSIRRVATPAPGVSPLSWLAELAESLREVDLEELWELDELCKRMSATIAEERRIKELPLN